ncbi:MAG: hypothetical protein L0H63_13585 [Nitrococcus sp.]|nr:hypothetical protein [Nitrococcus sp.]
MGWRSTGTFDGALAGPTTTRLHTSRGARTAPAGGASRCWERGPAAWPWRPGDQLKLRAQLVDESLLLYSSEREALLQLAEQRTNGRYLYRPANIEDVFLSLTGWELRD